MMKKRIVILGSTGSIGESALKVVEQLSNRLQVVGLAACRSTGRLFEQAAKFGVRTVAVADPAAASGAAAEAPAGVKVLAGPDGVEALAAMEDADIVLAATVGMSGLKPVLAALARGRNVALATKEVLVAAGELVTGACARTGARLIPVDSEHSAIFQCMGAGAASAVRSIILTASGGPFANKPGVDFDSVTVAEALKHPRWNMGNKVTIDSATMMNKGLELMEARWLFGLPMDRMEVLVHPESIVHSLVQFVDGSVFAQLSLSDMRYAIQYALTWPDRVEGNLPHLDLAAIGRLHFSRPDANRFPCLGLACAASAAGGTMPAVLSAANEIAVERFLAGEMAFAGIWRVVERVMSEHSAVLRPGLDAILDADAWARARTRELAREHPRKA